jgi:hypothetical protein
MLRLPQEGQVRRIKKFLFEKKNQKTFASLVDRVRSDRPAGIAEAAGI